MNDDLKVKEKGQGSRPVTADDALLDEFFSLVASIAARLTCPAVPNNNINDSAGREVTKS